MRKVFRDTLGRLFLIHTLCSLLMLLPPLPRLSFVSHPSALHLPVLPRRASRRDQAVTLRSTEQSVGHVGLPGHCQTPGFTSITTTMSVSIPARLPGRRLTRLSRRPRIWWCIIP
jgi:hypothetical protein